MSPLGFGSATGSGALGAGADVVAAACSAA
jgi:hypothetical protein